MRQIQLPTAEYKIKESVHNPSAYTKAYLLCDTKTELVEFDMDPTKDMFQIGRCKRLNIDFGVYDNSCMKNHPHVNTISRFACRIEVNRAHPNSISVFAAGFDENRNIFLGENASKWYSSSGEIDGFTTNGIYICPAINGVHLEWAQVSVEGNAYPIQAGQKR